MKLGFVFNTAFTEYEGNYYSINLTEELMEKRYLKYFDEVVVIGRFRRAKEDPSGKMTRSNSERVQFRCIEDKPFTKRIMSLRGEERFVAESVKDCDAVICRGWWGVSTLRKMHMPYMIEVVNNIWDSYWYHSSAGKVAAVPNYVLQRRAVKHAPYVLYVSKFFLQDKYPTKGKSIGCPDVWLETPDPAVLERRIEKIKQTKTDFCIGLIGSNSVNYRGHDTLIRAIKVLSDQGINCIAKFLGGGSPSKWESLAKELNVSDKVVFCGMLPHGDKVMEWIDDIDVLAMPTAAESLGRAVIEAMSRGCPVIGTVETALREQIGSDCLIHVGDYRALAAKLAQLHADKEYMEYCAKENFYRSYKYTNEQTQAARDAFMREFLKTVT